MPARRWPSFEESQPAQSVLLRHMKRVVTGHKRGVIRIMRDRQYSLVSRSHLLRMTRLAQRAVDYSIKAYELGSFELCHIVRNTEDELCKLQLNIGDRGRLLRAEGRPVDTESTASSCALRVYSALQVTYFAAAEIAQNTMLLLESGRKTQFPSKMVTTNFVNGLVRLYTVALFDEDIQHARMILKVNEGHRQFDLQLSLREEELNYRNDARARFELAITHCLAQIVEQAHEIANTLMQWFGRPQPVCAESPLEIIPAGVREYQSCSSRTPP